MDCFWAGKIWKTTTFFSFYFLKKKLGTTISSYITGQKNKKKTAVGDKYSLMVNHRMTKVCRLHDQAKFYHQHQHQHIPVCFSFFRPRKLAMGLGFELSYLLLRLYGFQRAPIKIIFSDIVNHSMLLLSTDFLIYFLSLSTLFRM